MDILDYLKTLDFDAVCNKLAQYEIGNRLHVEDANLENEIQLAGGKKQYLNNVKNYYIDTFRDKKSALNWFGNKNISTIESFILTFYCAY